MKHFKAVALIGLCLPVLALAQENAPRVDQRQINQEARIQQGAASGSLTPRETVTLERGQTRVQNIEMQAKADGVVTRQERQRLHHVQDVQSDHIRHQKHDRQHDYNHNGRNDHYPRRG
ncbi:MAG: hypothetical protein FIB06_12965 [Betaproteobacteria bacterium]|nr:hypothetical protein [Betaproteobacteria bacterium]